jgi:F-type H+-transporting ATPase subunit gamma
MSNPRKLDKRRKSIRNIRKITRTMELIARARFKKALDRAHAASAYTDRIRQLVDDLTRAGLELNHPLLETRAEPGRAILLVLTSNRGLCGGFNSNLLRLGTSRWHELGRTAPEAELEVSGKRGISALKFRGLTPRETFTHFEDKPRFDEVELLADRYLGDFVARRLDRLDVVYTRFESVSRQGAVCETLLPLAVEAPSAGSSKRGETSYEFLPSAESILEEVLPTSFKVRLFKCFLDSAVSEQIARMIAMKSATENADELIRALSIQYNRARQGQITSELTDLLGGVEALKG